MVVAFCGVTYDMAMAQAVMAPKTMADVKVSYAEAVKKISPTVVNIFTKTKVERAVNPFFSDPTFELFFGQSLGGVRRERVEQSLGSGVIIADDGTFVTNFHVVQGASEVKVMSAEGEAFEVDYMTGDKDLDIAVFKIKAKRKFAYAELADSDALEVGDLVLAIGNPFGIGQSVSMGIVSALGRSNIGQSSAENFIQTDAAINPGNSGGALVDSRGRLVGINTAIFSQSGGSQGIGFAIPANTVRAVMNSVFSTGDIQRPWLGAEGQDLTTILAQSLGLKRAQGFLINDVMPNSPAFKAGIQVGDIILSFNGYDIANERALYGRMAQTSLGKKVPVEILRAGKQKQVYLSLEALPPRDPNAQKMLKGSHPLNGYVVEQISPSLAHELRLPYDVKGVAIIQTPKRPTTFGIATMRVGDIITEVNDTEVTTLEELEEALAVRRRGWKIIVKRGRQTLQIIAR